MSKKNQTTTQKKGKVQPASAPVELNCMGPAQSLPEKDKCIAPAQTLPENESLADSSQETEADLQLGAAMSSEGVPAAVNEVTFTAQVTEVNPLASKKPMNGGSLGKVRLVNAHTGKLIAAAIPEARAKQLVADNPNLKIQ